MWCYYIQLRSEFSSWLDLENSPNSVSKKRIMNQSRILMQLHPRWVNLGIIESQGHSKGIGGRTFQQNRSLVQAWGSWWLVIGSLDIELGSPAKFGWLLQWLPLFCQKKISDLRWIWLEEHPLEHWHQLCWPCWAIFQMSKACHRMPCDKSTQMRGWGRVVPCQISSVLTLKHEINQNHSKTYSRIEAYAKVAINCGTFSPKWRLPKFGLGFPFFVIDLHLEATPGTTLWSFWGTVATTAWGGVSFGSCRAKYLKDIFFVEHVKTRINARTKHNSLPILYMLEHLSSITIKRSFAAQRLSSVGVTMTPHGGLRLQKMPLNTVRGPAW